MTHLSSDYVRRDVFTHQGCAYLKMSQRIFGNREMCNGPIGRGTNGQAHIAQREPALQQKSQDKNYYYNVVSSFSFRFVEVKVIDSGREYVSMILLRT